jgi:hypothetical protein
LAALLAQAQALWLLRRQRLGGCRGMPLLRHKPFPLAPLRALALAAALVFKAAYMPRILALNSQKLMFSTKTPA